MSIKNYDLSLAPKDGRRFLIKMPNYFDLVMCWFYDGYYRVSGDFQIMESLEGDFICIDSYEALNSAEYFILLDALDL